MKEQRCRMNFSLFGVGSSSFLSLILHPYIPLHFIEMIFPLVPSIFVVWKSHNKNNCAHMCKRTTLPLPPPLIVLQHSGQWGAARPAGGTCKIMHVRSVRAGQLAKLETAQRQLEQVSAHFLPTRVVRLAAECLCLNELGFFHSSFKITGWQLG